MTDLDTIGSQAREIIALKLKLSELGAGPVELSDMARPNPRPVYDLQGLITRVARLAFGCPTCTAKGSEGCHPVSDDSKETRMHIGRWDRAERLLRPHTHYGAPARRFG